MIHIRTKEDSHIFQIKTIRQSITDKNTTNSYFNMWPPPETLTRNQQVSIVFNSPSDNNCLFHCFIHKLEGLRAGEISKEEVREMKFELMDFLLENTNTEDPYNNAIIRNHACLGLLGLGGDRHI
jgi:hypothetical protein